MNYCKIGSLALIVAALALSACARKLPSAGNKVDLGVVVGGEPLDQIVSKKAVRKRGDRSEEILEKVFGSELAKGAGRERLKEALRALDEGRSGDSDIAALDGLAGYSAWQLGRGILFPVFKSETKGLIGDYLVFFDKAREFGYGHLTVDMETKEYFTEESYKAQTPDRTILYQWHIKVVKNEKYDGFEVHERKGEVGNPNDPNYPNNPFPDTVTFPDYSLDPDDERSIWARGLDHKLFAKGKEVIVRDVFFQVKRGMNEGPLVRLDNSHRFYRRTNESCVDLLTRGKPPTHRIEFPEQSGYCLGRCAQPDVFNSV